MKKHKIWFIIAIVIAGIILRVAWLYWTDSEADDDAGEYQRLGWQVADGFAYEDRGMRSWRPPGYPFLLSIAYRAGLNREIGARVVDVIVGVGFPLVLGLIVCTLCGWAVGLLAMFFFMIYPNNICLAGVSMSEMPFCLFFYSSLLLGLYGKKAKSKWQVSITYLICGGVLGYAMLTRTTAALAIPFMFCYFGIKDWKKRKVSFVVILSLFLGLAIVLSPWAIRNWRVHNRFVLVSTNGGEVFYSANNVSDPQKGGCYNVPNYVYLRNIESDEVLRSKLGFKLGLRSIMQNPAIFIQSLPFRYARFLYVYDESAKVTGFSIQRKEFKYRIVFSALIKLIYFCIPICLIIFYKRIKHSLMRHSEVRFFSALYFVYFLVLPLFEVTTRAHFPYMWLIVLILIYSINSDEGS